VHKLLTRVNAGTRFDPSTGVRGMAVLLDAREPPVLRPGALMKDSAGGDHPPPRFTFANASVPSDDTRINPNRNTIGSTAGGTGIAVSG